MSAPPVLLALALALLTAFIGGNRLLAQDAKPASGDISVSPRPAHIHAGTCVALGEVVFPLTDLRATNLSATPVADALGTAEGAQDPALASPAVGDVGQRIEQSETIVQASLDDILGAEHAINVHLSPEGFKFYIACGEITGTPTDGSLTISLFELNDSDFEGNAVLADNGDGTTTVTVQIYRTTDELLASPEASPVS